MAAPVYTTFAKVQAVRPSAFAAAIPAVTEDNCGAIEAVHAKPIIDAKLTGRGAPWAALASVPDLVQAIDAFLIAAAVFDDRAWKIAKGSELATEVREMAMGWLEDIRAGRLTPSGITAGGSFLTSDPDEDRPETEVFTGTDDLDWLARTEERES